MRLRLKNILIPKHTHKPVNSIRPSFTKVFKPEKKKKPSKLNDCLIRSEVNLILAQTQLTLIAILIHQLSSHVFIFLCCQ